MKVIHENNPKDGFFMIKENYEAIAEMTYVWSGNDNFVIDHTAVLHNYRGQGLGKQMLASAIQFARDNNLTIIPLCPFAKSEFNKNESYNDVLKI